MATRFDQECPLGNGKDDKGISGWNWLVGIDPLIWLCSLQLAAQSTGFVLVSRPANCNSPAEHRGANMSILLAFSYLTILGLCRLRVASDTSPLPPFS